MADVPDETPRFAYGVILDFRTASLMAFSSNRSLTRSFVESSIRSPWKDHCARLPFIPRSKMYSSSFTPMNLGAHPPQMRRATTRKCSMSSSSLVIGLMTYYRPLHTRSLVPSNPGHDLPPDLAHSPSSSVAHWSHGYATFTRPTAELLARRHTYRRTKEPC